MLASVTMCKDDIRNSNRKIIQLGDLGYLTYNIIQQSLNEEVEEPSLFITREMYCA